MGSVADVERIVVVTQITFIEVSTIQAITEGTSFTEVDGSVEEIVINFITNQTLSERSTVQAFIKGTSLTGV